MSEESEPESGEREHFGAEMFEQRQHHHEENIQILVAVGFLGAYFTVVSSPAIDLPGNLRFLVDLIFGITLLFLVLKLAKNSTTPVTSGEWLEPIDRYLPLAFFVSVIGTFLIVGVLYLDIRFTGLIEESSRFLTGVIFFLMIVSIPIVFFLGTKHQYNVAERRRDSLDEKLQMVLTNLTAQGVIEEAKRDSLLERYEKVFAHDESLSMWAFQSDGGLIELLKGRPAFTINELGYLLTTLDRIETDMKHESIDDRDVEAIEELLRQAESRMSPNWDSATLSESSPNKSAE